MSPLFSPAAAAAGCLLKRSVLRAGNAPDSDEVLEGLAHLEALDVEVAQVQEVVDPLAAAARAARRVVKRLRLPPTPPRHKEFVHLKSIVC